MACSAFTYTRVHAAHAQGSMHSLDIGELPMRFAAEDAGSADRSAYVPRPDRMERLRKAIAAMPGAVADAVAAWALLSRS